MSISDASCSVARSVLTVASLFRTSFIWMLLFVCIPMSVTAYGGLDLVEYSGVDPRDIPSNHREQITAIKKPSSHSKHRGTRRRHSAEEPATCCYNGGLCVLESFCHCPVGYHGRFCEFSFRSCGPIPHDEWINDGCAMCHCEDGVFACLAGVLDDCGEKPAVLKHLKIAFYENKKLPEETTASPEVDPKAVKELIAVLKKMGKNIESSGSKHLIGFSLMLVSLVISMYSR